MSEPEFGLYNNKMYSLSKHYHIAISWPVVTKKKKKTQHKLQIAYVKFALDNSGITEG